MKDLKVIVLILSYNGKELLEEAISSYLVNTYKNFEVVIIDNGSIDGTKDYIEKNWKDIKVLRTEDNLGYSGGFNLGLEYAFGLKRSDFVLISNNDVKVDKDMITEMVKTAKKDKKIGFVTGKVYYYDNPEVFQTIGKFEDPISWNGDHIGANEKDTGQYEEVKERVFADDVAILVRRQLYEDVGGYDTEFFLQSEETDWQARAKKFNYRIVYTPNAKIWHKVGMTIGKDSPHRAFYDARNNLIILLKYKSPDFFRKYFWNHLWYGVLRVSLIYFKSGKIKMSVKTWEGFFSAILWGLKNSKFTFKHFI